MKEPTRRALLLSGVRSSTLKSQLAPVKPADKKFDEIVAVLTKHYSRPELSFLLESTPVGRVGVCFHCINDDVTQKKLLDEPTITYRRAIELAESAEAAARGQREMKTPLQTVKVEPQTVQKVATWTDAPNREVKGIVCHRARALGYGMSSQGQDMP